MKKVGVLLLSVCLFMSSILVGRADVKDQYNYKVVVLTDYKYQLNGIHSNGKDDTFVVGQEVGDKLLLGTINKEGKEVLPLTDSSNTDVNATYYDNGVKPYTSFDVFSDEQQIYPGYYPVKSSDNQTVAIYNFKDKINKEKVSADISINDTQQSGNTCLVLYSESASCVQVQTSISTNSIYTANGEKLVENGYFLEGDYIAIANDKSQMALAKIEKTNTTTVKTADLNMFMPIYIMAIVVVTAGLLFIKWRKQISVK